MSDGDEAVDKVVQTVGLWWPDAEEGDIRRAADAWDQLATALENAGAEGRGGANQAMAHWQGEAADTFRGHWSQVEGAVAPTAEGCRSLASGLREYAQAVEDAKQEVYVLAIEIGASIAIGAALAFFTFGTSAAAAGGAVAALRVAALRIAAQLTARVGTIAARAIIGASFGSVSSFAANLGVAQPVRVEVFGNGGYSLPQALQAGAFGGVTGGVLGGAGGALAKFRPGTGGAAPEIPGLPPRGTGAGAADDSVPAGTPGGSAVPSNPGAYSVAYQMRLDPADLGKSRSVHFNRANADLDAALRSDPAFASQMDQLSPGVADRVSSTGGRQNPIDHTWHHATNAQGGGDGAMQLVPTSQHRPGSPFQPVIHPDGGGGYAEWAVPNGAPPNR